MISHVTINQEAELIIIKWLPSCKYFKNWPQMVRYFLIKYSILFGYSIIKFLFFIESLQPLLEDKFDPKIFATQTIQSQIVGEMLQKLMQGISELDNELYSQVCWALYKERTYS